MNRLFVLTGTSVAAVLTVLMFASDQLADQHVRHIMGGIPAPTNCLSCHAYMNQGGLVKAVFEEPYLSPHDLAVSPDGRFVFVVAEESNLLLKVDAGSGRVVSRIELGHKPHSIALSPDGQTAYVTVSWDDHVEVVDLSAEKVTGAIATGATPKGVAVSSDGNTLFVANSTSDDISIIEAKSGNEIRRIAAGNNPYAVRLAPGGKEVYVTSRLSLPIQPRDPAITEVTVLDSETGRIAERKLVRKAHLIESVDFASEGDLAFVTLVRPKNLIPSTQLPRGWMLTYGIGVLDTRREGRIVQLLLDEPTAYYADPYDVAVIPNGRYAFVSHAAANAISVIDLKALRSVLESATDDSLTTYANDLGISSRFVVKRIKTGANPKRLRLSPDGKRLYVAEQLEDRLSVIDTERLVVVNRIDLGGPKKITTLREGARQFHAARALQGQFSCRSCHPDGDQDAISWDFGGDGMGRNIVNTMTLRDIGHTSPYKWAGSNVSLYMQDGIRFAKQLTRVDPWPAGQLKANVAYMYSIPQLPNRYMRGQAELTEAQKRGKAIFDRTVNLKGTPIPVELQCGTCHSGSYLTNRKKFNVGTKRESDNMDVLDTPQLVNIYDSDPYLHDGSAQTLEEIWTKNSLKDEHGVINDLNKNQLNDLIDYLRTISSPRNN